MSAAIAILSQVWAMIESQSVANSADQRKGPRQLRLVGAARPAQARPAYTPVPQLAFYRKYTETLLDHSMKLSFDAARVSSLMGREIFQGNVSHSRMKGFDDAVHLVHDVDRCFTKLRPGHQHLLRRIAMEGYTHSETAAMLGLSLRSVYRHYSRALDELTQLLLEHHLLEPAVLSGGDAVR